MNQKQFWLINQIQPNNPAYNIPSVFIINGPLNISAVEQSINEIIHRHEIFRTSFTDREGRFTREIVKTRPVKVQITDISDLPQAKQINEQNLLINQEITKPFDLRSGPLLRAHIILSIRRKKHVLVIVMHHIITDLHAKTLFASELSSFYNSISSGIPTPSLETPLQYSDHVHWKQEWSRTPAAEAEIKFWQQELKEQTGLLNLPLDHPRPPLSTYNGKAQHFKITSKLTRKLQEFSRQNSVDIFVTLLSVYLVLLFRYTNQNDITIGVPLTNRRRENDKKIMACFVNILPLAFNLSDSTIFDDILREVRVKMLTSHRNQEASFDSIVEAIQPRRDPSYNPLFQVGFTVEPPMELMLHDLEVTPLKTHNNGAQLDIFLNIWSMKNEIQGYFEYNTDLFDQPTIERLNNHYRNLLQSILSHSDQEISRLEILAPEEKEKLIRKWNDTRKDYGQPVCIQELFENQARKSPDTPALIFEETQLTYRQLNEKANQLAHCLINQGIGPDDLVGIFMERSLEMVIAIYGVIKAGGAYVPLDPDFPEQRTAFILTETRARALLTQSHLLTRLPASTIAPLCLDRDRQLVDSFPKTNPESPVNAKNLAYVIYTSGSTGTPKGVMNEHRGIYNRLLWMQDTFLLDSSDTILQKTPFSFDVSVWEFFWPLCTGARLVLAPPGAHKDPTHLYQLIRTHTITTIHFVPSMLRMFLDAGDSGKCKSLKRVICSGEALSWDLQNLFFKNLDCELHNLYGPTEAAIDVTYWHCDKKNNHNKVPIGFPIANTRTFILDKYLQPVPLGTAGELHIGGIQVARGYINRPELNSEKFINNPFSNSPEDRLYKTGDLARYLPDGAIEYLGRVDFQIKLHGNRIEPAEIESVLCRHPKINDALVTVKSTPSGKKQLVAYIIPSAKGREDLHLRQYLMDLLPSYMIPNLFIPLQEFPLTPSGKIDRKRLPEQEVTGQDSIVKTAADSFSRQLLSIWRRVLETKEIGIHDNFFDAGGNSLLATQLTIEMEREFNTNIHIVKIFQHPTIASFTDYLQQHLSHGKPESTVQNRARLLRRTLAQRKAARS